MAEPVLLKREGGRSKEDVLMDLKFLVPPEKHRKLYDLLNEYAASGNTTSYSMDGRVPPQAVDIEGQCLGEIMRENSLLSLIDDLKAAEDIWHADYHRKIYQSMVSLHEQKIPIDLITLAEELRKKGHLELVGGEPYLAELEMNAIQTNVPTFTYHLRIVTEKAMGRNLITVCSGAINKAYSPVDDVFGVYQETIKALTEAIPNAGKISIDIGTHLAKAEKAFEELIERGGKPVISWGHKEFDRITYGVRPRKMVFLASRPSMGKTTVALNLMNEVASQGVPVLMFAEDIAEDLTYKLLALETGVDSSKFVYHPGEEFNNEVLERISAASKKLKEKKIFISSDEFILEKMLRTVAEVKAREPNLGLIVVDNLQTFLGHEAYRKKEGIYKEILTRFKYEVGQAYNVDVLMLAQLNMWVEIMKDKYIGKRPSDANCLQDQEAGVLEIADNVIFLYRPEEYYPDPKANDLPKFLKGTSYKGYVELITIKGRMGKPDKRIVMNFNKEISRISSRQGNEQ